MWRLLLHPASTSHIPIGSRHRTRVIPAELRLDIAVVDGSIPTAGRPTLRANIRAEADANTEGAVTGAGAPGPAGALADGQMVPAEGEVGDNGAKRRAGEQVDALVPEVGVAGRGNVGGSAARR